MNIRLLAPKHARAGGNLPDHRGTLSVRLQEFRHRPILFESEPDEPGDTLRAKFLRLAGECSQAVVVWPPDAAMATTADEIVLLQEAFDLAPLDIVMVLHESEVEQRADELFVHFPPDQSRYLDGILACQPFIVPWAAGEPFEEVVDRYVDAFL